MYKLYAPEGYWNLTPEQKRQCCNGGGPKGFGLLVPDSLWGLNCSDVFDIHDYGFSEEFRPAPEGGWSDEDFHTQNRILRNNLYRKIYALTGNRLLRKLRCMRADKYVAAVESGIGALIYWSGKNKPEEMG